MSPRGASWWGIAAPTAIVLVVGAVLVLGAIALVRRDQREPIGGEIVWDDFGFRVLGVKTAREYGASGDKFHLAANGLFRIVRMEVANHAQRVDYRLDSHRAVLLDAAGEVYEIDPRISHVWIKSTGGGGTSASIAPGEKAVADLTFDVPVEARGLTLRIDWGGPVIAVIDHVVFGDRRIVLE